MAGTEGVIEIEGALNLGGRAGADESLMEMLGMLGETEIDGTSYLLPRVKVGASLMEMVGTSGITEMVGTLTLPDLLGAAGLSLMEILGIGGVIPIDGTLTWGFRLLGPSVEKEGVSEIEIVGTAGPGAVF
jgi:hypothetical protein